MGNTTSILNGLTDEQILDEFVKRFECDGAVLVYLDSNTEYGFARWTNTTGKKWANELLCAAQQNNSMPGFDQSLIENEKTIKELEFNKEMAAI